MPIRQSKHIKLVYRSIFKQNAWDESSSRQGSTGIHYYWEHSV